MSFVFLWVSYGVHWFPGWFSYSFRGVGFLSVFLLGFPLFLCFLCFCLLISFGLLLMFGWFIMVSYGFLMFSDWFSYGFLLCRPLVGFLACFLQFHLLD